MLKFQLDSLDGVDETVRALYTEKDGKFVLGIEGLPQPEDVSGLKSKVEELLGEKKAAENPTMIHRMNDSAWKRARIRATKKWLEKHLRAPHEGFTRIRVHDLKHTFGRRLRAAGVTLEDRKALLGHKNGSITSH